MTPARKAHIARLNKHNRSKAGRAAISKGMRKLKASKRGIEIPVDMIPAGPLSSFKKKRRKADLPLDTARIPNKPSIKSLSITQHERTIAGLIIAVADWLHGKK